MTATIRAEPCIVCGAPIVDGSGHDDGCMVAPLVTPPGGMPSIYHAHSGGAVHNHRHYRTAEYAPSSVYVADGRHDARLHHSHAGAAPGTVWAADSSPVPVTLHPVNAGGVEWFGGMGHALLSTDDGGVECYRCGMAAEGSAYQELIPDCTGPGGGDHHWMGHGDTCNDCAYGDASIGTDGYRRDRVYAPCRRA